MFKTMVGCTKAYLLALTLMTKVCPASTVSKQNKPRLPVVAVRIAPLNSVIVIVTFRIPCPVEVKTRPATETYAALGARDVSCQNPPWMPKRVLADLVPATGCEFVPATVIVPTLLEPPPFAITDCSILNWPPLCAEADVDKNNESQSEARTVLVNRYFICLILLFCLTVKPHVQAVFHDIVADLVEHSSANILVA